MGLSFAHFLKTLCRHVHSCAKNISVEFSKCVCILLQFHLDLISLLYTHSLEMIYDHLWSQYLSEEGVRNVIAANFEKSLRQSKFHIYVSGKKWLAWLLGDAQHSLTRYYLTHGFWVLVFFFLFRRRLQTIVGCVWYL